MLVINMGTGSSELRGRCVRTVCFTFYRATVRTKNCFPCSLP